MLTLAHLVGYLSDSVRLEHRPLVRHRDKDAPSVFAFVLVLNFLALSHIFTCITTTRGGRCTELRALLPTAKTHGQKIIYEVMGPSDSKRKRVK